MNFQTVKTGFLVAALSVFLAACSSTSTEDSADGAGLSDGMSTGTAGSGSAFGDGSDLGAGGVDTVFYFDFDKATLKSEARAALNIHAERLRSSPRSIRLEGHGDERGSREYNMALGERRGNAVKEYLMLQGVDGNVLEVISYGEERPAAMGSDEGSWSMNRRVEMKK